MFGLYLLSVVITYYYLRWARKNVTAVTKKHWTYKDVRTCLFLSLFSVIAIVIMTVTVIKAKTAGKTPPKWL